MTKITSKPRLLPGYQAYNNIHKERVGPIILKQWTDSVLLKRPISEKEMAIPPVPIDFRNAALRALLEAEPPAIKAEVEIWRQAQRTADDPQEKEQHDNDGDMPNMASVYHR